MTIAFVILILAAAYFLLLGAACLLVPSVAKRFLLGFAGSAGKHFLEMALRMIVGAALVAEGPNLPYSAVFTVFGWMLIGTTAVLLITPWRWHHRFASMVLPKVAGSLPLIGVVSTAVGAGIMWCLVGSALAGN
jgi:hypothetical protein